MQRGVLATPPLAARVPACCRPPGARRLSAWILEAEVSASRDAAGLCCLSWPCRAADASRHSLWVPRADLEFVERVRDPDASLGAASSEFARENLGVELWEGGRRCGRFVAAARPLRPGDCALRATAFAVVVRQPRERCHWCLAALKKRALQCGDCRFARYCSRECLSAHELLHAFQCRALMAVAARQSSAEARGTRAVDSADWEVIRLVLEVLSMEALLGHSEVLSRLVTNNQSWTGDSATAKEAQRIVTAETPVRSARHVLRILRRVQCNAHPVSVESNLVCGVGVFPEAAMTLNHSCTPNVVPSFDPQTRTLAFYAIGDIPRGHTVEYAYIDMMQSRQQRQRLLLDGFGFRCSCPRCFEESQRESPDSLEDGQVGREVTMRLMEMNAAPQLPQVEIDRVCQAYSQYFEQHDDAAFALHMVALKHARARRDWACIVASAEALMETWIADFTYGQSSLLGNSLVLGSNDEPYSDRAIVCIRQGRHYNPVTVNDALEANSAVVIDTNGTSISGYRVVNRSVTVITPGKYNDYASISDEL